MPSRYLHLWLVGLFGLMLFAIALDETFAAEPSAPLFDVYSLNSEASMDVANDVMIATLVAQGEDKDAAALAQYINSTMSWALSELEAFPAIDVETLAYRTQPQFEGNYSSQSTRRITGWYASQTVQLKTTDFEAASKAVRVLQDRLQVESMRMSTLEATRRAAEDTLIEEALAAFRQRAELVQNSMAADGYRVVDINIGGNGFAEPAYRNFQAEAMDMASGPAIEAGSSRVSVRIDGRIQLQ